MNTDFINIIPVLSSADIERDVKWYNEKMGLDCYFSDSMYAILYRESLWLHLQWHSGTVDDPLSGGAVVRIYMKNIAAIFDEFQKRGTVTADKLRSNTPWGTNEFGFYDLNSNAIFIMEDVTLGTELQN